MEGEGMKDEVLKKNTTANQTISAVSIRIYNTEPYTTTTILDFTILL
jgi:hypothetical protein